jgi:hypothetical protein
MGGGVRKIGKRKVKIAYKKNQREKKEINKESLSLQKEKETHSQENDAEKIKREERERQVSSQKYSCHKEESNSNDRFFHQSTKVTFCSPARESAMTEIIVLTVCRDVPLVRPVQSAIRSANSALSILSPPFGFSYSIISFSPAFIMSSYALEP